MPRKVAKAKELSPYGAERNMPAGDMVCRHAAVKAVCCLYCCTDGMRRVTKAYREITAPRCERWETMMPVRAFRTIGDVWRNEGRTEIGT